MVDRDLALDMRLNKKMKLREIAEVFGVTRERVRQVIGNTGPVRSMALRKDRESIAKQLYIDRTIGKEHLCKKYNMTWGSIRGIIGSRVSLFKSIGKQRCCYCEKLKDRSEFYTNNRGTLTVVCKSCNTIHASQYYHDNHKHALAVHTAWQQANPDKVRAYSKKWEMKRGNISNG